MKRVNVILLLSMVLIVSCDNPKQTTSNTGSDTLKPVENKIMIPASTCYSSITGKDTIKLKVEVFPNVVTGKLMYDFNEKDSNSGTFDGHLHGDTLLADYKFTSEGKLSTRQVIFLIKDSIAIEGFGELEEKEGKMVIKDLKKVSFEKGIIFKKVECGEY